MGAFKPPVPNAGDTCYISDHTDIGIGMNAATANPEAAKTFLAWVGKRRSSPRSSAMRFPASSHCRTTPVELEDPLAQKSSSAGAASAKAPSARPIRSCRAARPTSRTRPGTRVGGSGSRARVAGRLGQELAGQVSPAGTHRSSKPDPLAAHLRADCPPGSLPSRRQS